MTICRKAPVNDEQGDADERKPQQWLSRQATQS
jgi:hypothetical protein